jgi:1-acyl-sn-glycerol-3-phosphate acyltransferase
MTVATARAQVNRILLVIALGIALPLVAVVERVRPGRGQPVALRCVRLAARWCGVKFEVRIPPGATMPQVAIYTPNHSSPMDIPALLVARPDIRFLAAADLFRVPLLSAAMRAVKAIPIDRSDSAAAHRQLDALMASSDRAYDLAIFPEGGIAPRYGRLPFKTGAFALAIQTGTPIVPVAIHASAEVLPPRKFLAVRAGTVIVELLEPVDPAGLTIDDRGELGDRIERAVRTALEAGPSRS